MIVTANAAFQYCQHVDPSASEADARAVLMQHERAVAFAASVHCRSVKCARYRLSLDGDRVLTVLAKGLPNLALKPGNEERYARH